MLLTSLLLSVFGEGVAGGVALWDAFLHLEKRRLLQLRYLGVSGLVPEPSPFCPSKLLEGLLIFYTLHVQVSEAERGFTFPPSLGFLEFTY